MDVIEERRGYICGELVSSLQGVLEIKYTKFKKHDLEIYVRVFESNWCRAVRLHVAR